MQASLVSSRYVSSFVWINEHCDTKNVFSSTRYLLFLFHIILFFYWCFYAIQLIIFSIHVDVFVSSNAELWLYLCTMQQLCNDSIAFDIALMPEALLSIFLLFLFNSNHSFYYYNLFFELKNGTECLSKCWICWWKIKIIILHFDAAFWRWKMALLLANSWMKIHILSIKFGIMPWILIICRSFFYIFTSDFFFKAEKVFFFLISHSIEFANKIERRLFFFW